MAEISAAARRTAAAHGQAMSTGSFPIRNGGDLQNAIRAVGRAKGGESGRAAVRRFIMKRAAAMGMTSQIPSTWNSDGSLKTP